MLSHSKYVYPSDGEIPHDVTTPPVGLVNGSTVGLRATPLVKIISSYG